MQEKKSTFVDRLKSLMEQSRTTQVDLARYCGVSKQAVGKWVQGGKVRQDYLPKVAELFGVSLNYLLTGQNVTIDSDARIRAAIHRADTHGNSEPKRQIQRKKEIAESQVVVFREKYHAAEAELQTLRRNRPRKHPPKKSEKNALGC